MIMTVEVFSSRKKCFSIFFLCAYYRGSNRTCSAKKGVLRNFTLFTGKRVLETPACMYYCEYCKIFKNTCFEEHLQMAASVTKASIYCFLALYSFKFTKHSHFSIFTTLHANSATRIKEHGDISYNSNVTII